MVRASAGSPSTSSETWKAVLRLKNRACWCIIALGHMSMTAMMRPLEILADGVLNIGGAKGLSCDFKSC